MHLQFFSLSIVSTPLLLWHVFEMASLPPPPCLPCICPPQSGQKVFVDVHTTLSCLFQILQYLSIMEEEILFRSLVWLAKPIATGPDFLSKQAPLVSPSQSLCSRYTNFLRSVMDQNLPPQEEAEV